jgi:hypothetical protein
MHTTVPSIGVQPFKGMPFSGTATTVWTRPMDGGGSVTAYATKKVFRDNEGRVYSERHHFAGPDVDPQTTLHEFSIADPVAQTRTVCEVASHHCIVTGYRLQLSEAIMPEGPFDNGKRNMVRTSLGSKEMEGLPITGTLETTTIAPGTIGNDRELTQSREFWYAADLKTNISITRKDPREGTQAVHLTVLSRSDPDPSVFAVPKGYTVEDKRRINRVVDYSK